MASMNTGVQGTDATWNVVAGCEFESPGCTNCYAMEIADGLSRSKNPKISGKYAGTAMTAANGKAVWTGKVRLWEPALKDPFKWRAPRRIFVNAMADQFHPGVSDQENAKVWAVTALNRRIPSRSSPSAPSGCASGSTIRRPRTWCRQRQRNCNRRRPGPGRCCAAGRPPSGY